MNHYTLSIPKPCHEDWGAMTQEEKGRFCTVCQKTVIDFTAMGRAEVDSFFDANAGTRVCGRFRTDQLSAPVTLEIPREALFMQRSFRNVFLLALVISMGATLFSCTRHTGEPALVGDVVVVDSSAAQTPSAPVTEDTTAQKAAQSVKPPTPARMMRIPLEPLGEVVPVMADTLKKPAEEPVKGKVLKSE